MAVGGPWRWPDGDTGPVLLVANIAVRAGLLVLTAAFAFTARWPGSAGLAVQIAGLTIAAAVLAWWVSANRLPVGRVRDAPLLPYALGAVILTCGMASATHIGGLFSLLSATAAISVGSDTSLAAGCVITGLGIAVTEVTCAASGTGATVMIAYPLGLVLGLAIGRNLRASRVRADQSTMLLARARQLREEQDQVAALDETGRIAQEIHDVLAHSLCALGLQIQIARAILTERHDEDKTDDLLGQAQRMAADGLAETRRAIQALRGQMLPLPEGLADLSTDHELRHSAAVRFTINGEPRPLPADAWLAITRTAEEALANSAKHAPGQPVEISLDYTGGSIALTVSNHLSDDPAADRGRPRFGADNGRYGLAGMRERLLLLSGTLTAGSDGSDWAVVATVPR
jgi:signal transduction histidine kinase